MANEPIQIAANSSGNRVTLGGDASKLLLIAGPCQIESLDHCLHVATYLKALAISYPVQIIFKSSFDKANRTKADSARGVGAEAGLGILAKVREESGLPVTTDVHTVEQARAAGQVVDLIQTPAFLCRQTDLLMAAGATGKPVNVKKGQFLHPDDMRFAVEKVRAGGGTKVLLTERGSTFGYRDLVVDMRSLVMMKQLEVPVIFDATHSVQSVGGKGGSSGGQREFVLPLAKAAVACGVDGLFIECHEAPQRAPSDGECMLPLEKLPELLDAVCKIREALRNPSTRA